MKNLALDLSSAITGWCIIDENLNLIAFGQIDLKKHKKKKFPLEYIKVLYDSIQNVVYQYKPDKAYIEDTFARNIMTIKILCKTRGIAEAALINAGIHNIELINAVSARKKTFGNGKLTSEECFEKLKILYPHQAELFYSKGCDIVDAIVLAIASTK